MVNLRKYLLLLIKITISHKMNKDIAEIYNKAKAFAKTQQFLDVIQTLKEAIKTIDISKPLEEVEQKAYGMLGNAYIKIKKPKAAIALLKPLHESGRGNTVTTNTLGNAYAIDKNQKGFETVKADTSPITMRDYLQAKLYYLNNQSSEALNVLKPYIIEAQNIRDVPTSIMGAYLSCTGNDSPLLEHLRASAGEEYFSFLMRRRDSWRADPTRAELANDFMFSSQTLWELGGTPASTQDRNGLGLSPVHGALVAVKQKTPTFG